MSLAKKGKLSPFKGKMRKKRNPLFPNVHSSEPSYRKAASFYRRYGITIEEKEAMIIDQRGLCFVCERQLKSRAEMDHDHETGIPTRVVCSWCNGVLEAVRKHGARITELIRIGQISKRREIA